VIQFPITRTTRIDDPSTEIKNVFTIRAMMRLYIPSHMKDHTPRSTGLHPVTYTMGRTMDLITGMGGCRGREIQVLLETSLRQIGSWMISFLAARRRMRVGHSRLRRKYHWLQKLMPMMDPGTHRRPITFL
jgi:hypothetical protein